MFSKIRIARSLCIAGVMLTVGGASLGTLESTTFASSVGPGITVVVGNPNYSTAGQQCDLSRDGYHFIMNGLEYPAGATITGADFGSIAITFSNGSTAVALFTDLSGSSTAHFINNTVNQTGNFTISSAQMTFPAGTDITGINQFRISHPPCGTVGSTTTTTTTVDSTTTTVDPYETTTSEAATTTTVDPYETTTSEAATTTTIDPYETTTTAAPQVASQSPVPVATTTTTLAASAAAPAVAAPALPVTGTNAETTAILGLFMLGAGLTLWGLSRRTRPLSR